VNVSAHVITALAASHRRENSHARYGHADAIASQRSRATRTFARGQSRRALGRRTHDCLLGGSRPPAPVSGTEACSSLFSFCVQRLADSENEAQKRIQVTRLYQRLPQILVELENGSVHLTGLSLLSPYLLSHVVPSGDLALLFERALDTLLEVETKRRRGADQPRRRRETRPGSRHVPLDVARAVWERDGFQCTFTGAQGRRCNERRFLTIEHRKPFARGGAASTDNLCLLCSAHNAARAREEFGEAHVEAKRLEAAAHQKTLCALVELGVRAAERQSRAGDVARDGHGA
jgi:5-methylcytosine-specific restriction endonuclease McrA